MMTLAEIPGELIGVAMLIGLVGGLIVMIVAIVYRAEVKVARAREESRREIAAYIAEGSMTPEQGERLMSAGGSLIQRVRNSIAG